MANYIPCAATSVRLFQYSISTNILIAINILIGWLFWGNLFYIPLYLQVVRGFSPSMAGSLILPMVIAHGATSCLSGIVMSMCGRYVPVISFGALLWTIGAGVKVTFGRETPIWLVSTVGVLEGVGVGCSLQPGWFCPFPSLANKVQVTDFGSAVVLVGLLAGSHKSDRAGITGLRNFVRDIGSTLGITGQSPLSIPSTSPSLLQKIDSREQRTENKTSSFWRNPQLRPAIRT